ncbi:MAG: tRNA(His) guanylyltransferase Thg1 family protein [Candidatus Bathyarchaeia archaeon]
MRESSLNEESLDQSYNEIFSHLKIARDMPFFVRLDGRRFQAVSDAVEAMKPFDEKFAQCLVASGKAIYEGDFNPALVYVASDEVNALFLSDAPFDGRIEKINSVLASLVSSTFSLAIAQHFKKALPVAFDSRVSICAKNKIIDYLCWRQLNLWRNHNNAYAYWLHRKIGHTPLETAKILKGLKADELHEKLFQYGINLAETPAWQRRGILIYKEPYQKKSGRLRVVRWRIKENWNLPLFSSQEGQTLIHQILKLTTQKKGSQIVRTLAKKD